MLPADRRRMRTCGSGSSRRRSSCRSPAIRRSAARSCSAGRCQKIVIRLETGSGVVPVELERDGPRIVFGWMEQPIPAWSSEPNASADPRGARGRVVGPAGRALRPRPRPRLRRARLAGRGCRRCGPTSPRSPARRPTAPTASRATAWAGRRGCSRPIHGVVEDPATGSAAGPLAIHLARHGRISFGEQIVISQGAEINRPSTLFAEVARRGRSDRPRSRRRLGRRRRARRVQLLSSTARISGSSTASARQNRPAVLRDVQPVAGRVDGLVRIVLRDRDRPAGRQAAAGLAPGHAGILRDEHRRLRVDDRDHGCSRDGSRQRGGAG